MKSHLLIFFFLIFVIPSAAQTPCVASSETAPALLDLRLGMSPPAVQNALGRELKIKIKNKGERTFFQNFIDKRPPPTLQRVRAIYLRFYDGRLYQIEIFFENAPGWQNLDDFTNYLRSALPLPVEWMTEKGRSEIRCEHFSIVADHVLNPRVEITDEDVRARIEELRKKKP